MTQVLPPCDGVGYYCGQLSMIRYVYLGSYDDKKKNFFSKLAKFINICPKLLKNAILNLFKTYPIRKSKIFGTINWIL